LEISTKNPCLALLLPNDGELSIFHPPAQRNGDGRDRVGNEAGNVIEMHEQKGEFKEP